MRLGALISRVAGGKLKNNFGSARGDQVIYDEAVRERVAQTQLLLIGTERHLFAAVSDLRVCDPVGVG